MEKNNFNNYTDLMNGLNCKGESTVRRAICNKSLSVELSEDLTLPDYLPELRKLLRMSVIPSAPSKFVSGSSVQLGGNVEYTFCYVGNDGDMYSASFPGEYSFNVPFDSDAEYDINEGIFADADVEVESALSRVNSARKLNVRTRLTAKSRVLAASRIPCAELGAEGEGEHIQRLSKSCDYSTELFGSNGEIEVRDELDLEAEKARYINSESCVFIEEVRACDGYVECRGNVNIKYLLYREGESTPYVLQRKSTFYEMVEVDGMCDGVAVSAYCKCVGNDARVEEEDGTKLTNVIRLCLSARGFKNESLEYVADAYSTEYECECERKRYRLPIALGCGNSNMTFNASENAETYIKVPEGGIVSVVDVCADAAIEKLEYDENKGKYMMCGKVSFDMILTGGADGNTELFGGSAELPFKMECASFASEPTGFVGNAQAIEPRVRCDGEKLTFECEIALAYSVLGENTADTVSSVSLSEHITAKNGGITVCYPDGDDSLWSVAKKYHAPLAETASDNGIDLASGADDSSALSGVRYLIV
ncbi:MAG: DUF3794 domain-containing protein [Clostridia bacterium]|nr:DUF3794 domain-containing protein [Clostridia bacterium]